MERTPPSYCCLGSLVQPYLPDIVSLKVRLEVRCSVVWGWEECILLSGSNEKERCEAKRICAIQYDIYISKLLNCRN